MSPDDVCGEIGDGRRIVVVATILIGSMLALGVL
jgi:hypothetical protein